MQGTQDECLLFLVTAELLLDFLYNTLILDTLLLGLAGLVLSIGWLSVVCSPPATIEMGTIFVAVARRIDVLSGASDFGVVRVVACHVTRPTTASGVEI